MRNQKTLKAICTALRIFANENDGSFPSRDESGREFTTSTEVFNYLLKSACIDSERVFWIKTGHPRKSRMPPIEDHRLEASENVYGYVSGLTDTSLAESPMVFEGLMDSPGVYGPHHPWLSKKQAMVGFVDTHVSRMPLSSTEAGATIMSLDGKTGNIFERAVINAGGKRVGGGFLDPAAKAVLLPE